MLYVPGRDTPGLPNARNAANFFCGDDPDARRIVKSLVEDVGFEAMDAGPLRNARLLEPMMLLWMVSSQALGTRDIAFKVLRR